MYDKRPLMFSIDGTDYIGGEKIETFPAMTEQMCTSFEILDDHIIEPNETFIVQIDINDPLVVEPAMPSVVIILDDDGIYITCTY